MQTKIASSSEILTASPKKDADEDEILFVSNSEMFEEPSK